GFRVLPQRQPWQGLRRGRLVGLLGVDHEDRKLRVGLVRLVHLLVVVLVHLVVGLVGFFVGFFVGLLVGLVVGLGLDVLVVDQHGGFHRRSLIRRPVERAGGPVPAAPSVGGCLRPAIRRPSPTGERACVGRYAVPCWHGDDHSQRCARPSRSWPGFAPLG